MAGGNKRPGKVPPRSAVMDFLRSEASGGIALVAASVIAIIWANIGASYFDFFHTEITIGIGGASITEDLQHWINDALMTIFFFVVALEIKRELVTGELRDRRAASLPVLAAFGGALLPALIFFAIVGSASPEGEGWAIPMATDIAFAVGVLALLGSRVSAGVKILLLTIAIVDDILAILVIALFYSSDLTPLWLLVAAGGLFAMVGLRRLGVVSVLPYIPLGFLVWLATFESGVHATMAGVAIGLLTPAGPFRGREVLDQIEHKLHPVSSFVIVPVFALANAGIAFSGGTIEEALASSLAMGIAVGLIAGKTVGIAGTVALVTKLRLGSLPAGVSSTQVWGVAALGGIGFTVSLFIAQLSYSDPVIVDVAKIGIFTGSVISSLLGVALLVRAHARASKSRTE